MRHALAAVGGLALLAATAPLALAPSPAGAQGNPNTQQIIESLRPGGNLLSGQSRGIRPVTPGTPGGAEPAAAQTPAPATPAAPGAVPAAAGTARPTAPQPPARPAGPPSVNLTVNFATASAELTPQAMRALDALGRALSSSELAGFRFRIEGHTDTTGATADNQALSERRAAAVVEYLASRFGVARDRMQAAGLGESQPRVRTGDEVNEPRNRRVQVVNLGA